MTYPQFFLDATQQAALSHMDDITAATEAAKVQIQQHPEYPEIVDALITSAIQHAIYDQRHRVNGEIKRNAAGGWKPPQSGSNGHPVVGLGTGAVAAALAKPSPFGYSVDGRRLGSLLGGQLIPLANQMQANADGYAWNATLLRRLAKIVPEQATVQETLTAAKLEKIMRQIKKGKKPQALAAAGH